jgi:L-rhamnose mutarotase
MTVYRRAWTMQLRDGAEAEYDSAHSAVWQELTEQMQAEGICRFQLFRAGLTVFAVQERLRPFPEADAPPSEVTRKWWQTMARLMVTDHAGRPVRTDLKEVFDLEKAMPGQEAPI